MTIKIIDSSDYTVQLTANEVMVRRGRRATINTMLEAAEAAGINIHGTDIMPALRWLAKEYKNWEITALMDYLRGRQYPPTGGN